MFTSGSNWRWLLTYASQPLCQIDLTSAAVSAVAVDAQLVHHSLKALPAVAGSDEAGRPTASLDLAGRFNLPISLPSK